MNDGNEFVWIPVNEGEFIRRDINLNNPLINQCHDYAYDSRQYSEMKKSVDMCNGFYIGRYEASKGENDNVIVKKDKKSYNYINWHDAKTKSEAMYPESASVKSTLCYGVEFDSILRFMEDAIVDNEKIDITKDSTKYGNFKNTEYMYFQNGSRSQKKPSGTEVIINTGAETDPKNRHCVKNIYDLAGNMYEWTMEVLNGDTNQCVERGGSLYVNGNQFPISLRTDEPSSKTSSGIGFRPALYIKDKS